ncbi:cytochrome P450 [Ustulina deusta]|nr:cytochrome P450 [Ustulina deusta]
MAIGLLNEQQQASAKLLLALGALLVAYFVIVIPAYNIFFHPLRKYPGPKLWAATQFPGLRTFIAGDLPKKTLELHNKYGPVVRTGPNELSFNSAEYWEAVMGHRKSVEPENMKAAYAAAHDPHSIVFASRDDHSRIRRMLSQGFSTSSMLEKQPIIRGYVDKLIKQLHERCQNGEAKINTGELHTWITLIFATIRASALMMGLRRVPILKPLLPLLISPKIIKQSIDHRKLTAEKVASYLLTANPKTLQKLVDEVRSSFTSEDEIDMVATGKLAYLQAVVEETLRIYPPAPNGFAREAPAEDAILLGQHVPAKTVLVCQHYSSYHSEANFKHPESFTPERFMGDPKFASDRREVLQPFNFGPRNCIGKNLAYVEIRMILARIVWNFDLTLAEECRNWFHENVEHGGFVVWAKPPLYVHFKPRKMGT